MPLDPRAREALDALQALGAPPIYEMSVEAARQFALEMLVQDDIPRTEVGAVDNRTIPGPAAISAPAPGSMQVLRCAESPPAASMCRMACYRIWLISGRPSRSWLPREGGVRPRSTWTA